MLMEILCGIFYIVPPYTLLRIYLKNTKSSVESLRSKKKTTTNNIFNI